jgi:small subunit ribosomal protein S17
MAEEDKTPETEATPDSIQEEVETAASEEGAGDTSTVETPADTPAAAAPSEPQEVLEPKERRARRRAAKKPAARGPVTPEQRDEERRARRAQKAKLRRAYRLRERTKAAEKRAAEPTPEPGHAPEHGPGRAKVRQGIVVSDKADKTIVVRVDVTRRHRRYGKIMRTSSKIHAHDERNDAGAGDTVRVIECRPMSRTKRWRLTDVLEKAK